MRAVLVFAFAALALPLGAQSGPPTWTLREDWRLRTSSVDLIQIQGLTVTPEGGVIVVSGQDRQIHRFEPGGRLRFTAGREGRGPGEFTLPQLARTTGDSLWVHDLMARRLTVLGPTGRYVRSVELTATRQLPPDAGALAGRTVTGLSPEYVTAQGEIVGWVTVPGATRNDASRQVLVRVARDSSLTVYTDRPDAGRSTVGWQGANGSYGFTPIPFAPRSFVGASPDGRRIVIAYAEVRDGPLRELLLRTVDAATGRSTEQQHTFRALPVSRARRDSAMRIVRGEVSRPMPVPPADAIARIEAEIPTTDDLIGRGQLLVAPDGTVYVPMQTAEHPALRYAVFAPSGAHTAWITLPAGVFLRAATDTHLWGTVTDDDGFPHVVRYAIVR
jgi:hypothetical protein